MTSWRNNMNKIENYSNFWTQWHENHGNKKRINFLAHVQAEIGKLGFVTSWHDVMTSRDNKKKSITDLNSVT